MIEFTSIPDLINGLFEGFASLFLLNHCRVLYKEKLVRGISIISTLFFFSWGGWNCYFYPQLGQKLSFYAGILVLIANGLWVSLMIYYRLREKHIQTQ